MALVTFLITLIRLTELFPIVNNLVGASLKRVVKQSRDRSAVVERRRTTMLRDNSEQHRNGHDDGRQSDQQSQRPHVQRAPIVAATRLHRRIQQSRTVALFFSFSSDSTDSTDSYHTLLLSTGLPVFVLLFSFSSCFVR